MYMKKLIEQNTSTFQVSNKSAIEKNSRFKSSINNIDNKYLRPEIINFLNENPSQSLSAFKTLPYQGIRKYFSAQIKKYTITEYKVNIINDYKINTKQGRILLRVYKPNSIATNKLYPILVCYHGGGWIAGSVLDYDNICNSLAIKCSCIVVSVDYIRAPKCKFPYTIQHCYEALEWVYNNAKKFAGEQNNIALIGDSAGGNIVAAIALMHKEKKKSWKIACQVLICPITDISSFDRPSYLSFNDYYLNKEVVLRCRQFYISKMKDVTHPYASPLLVQDLSHLPPTLIITGEFDILRDEGFFYSQRLKVSNVPTSYHCMKGMIHSSIFWPSASQVMSYEVNLICKYLKKNLRNKK